MSTAIAINSFVANLSFLFTEKPFMERFVAVKAAGLAKGLEQADHGALVQYYEKMAQMELNEVNHDDIS